ncbi:MAG: type I methionyl aminopeptidase [Spirochaetales bacterium]|nr:type I methionyl aminopeptidase [Spirochaetales bacterium]
MIKLKNEKQIDGIRKSCKMLARVYNEIEKHIVPGITTKELDDVARELILSGGGRPAFLNYHGYPGSLCTSVNSVVIHGIPGSQKLKEGDVISLDLGIDLDGYLSDSARTIPVGKISDEAQKLLDVTKLCLKKGIEAAVAGNRVKDISKAVFAVADKHGYGVVREFCGHGVGLELHEDPQIPNYVGRGPNPRLKPGMTIAIEPMINLGLDDVFIHEDEWTVETVDKLISAHFEHTIAIFEDHTEILTQID